MKNETKTDVNTCISDNKIQAEDINCDVIVDELGKLRALCDFLVVMQLDYPIENCYEVLGNLFRRYINRISDRIEVPDQKFEYFEAFPDVRSKDDVKCLCKEFMCIGQCLASIDKDSWNLEHLGYLGNVLTEYGQTILEYLEVQPVTEAGVWKSVN